MSTNIIAWRPNMVFQKNNLIQIIKYKAAEAAKFVGLVDPARHHNFVAFVVKKLRNQLQ